MTENDERREQLRFTWPCHRTCPPFVQPLISLSSNNLAEYRFLSSPFPCNLSIKIFLNIIPSIALEIPRSPFQEPLKILLSKFPSFRAQIGHLFHPSTISSFPICHARCVVSFSSPIATLLDRRAGHERRRSSLEEEKGDSGKRDEM